MERCAKCIMPVTAKGIRLDTDGLCQLCAGHREFVPKGERELRREICAHALGKSGFDCIVPVSGGRDSAYALYYAKRVLGLKPIAVHSDNDFETETANRNLEAISKNLGVPLLRIGTKRRLAARIVAEKIKMNVPFGPGLVVDQICEACQIGFESAAWNTARRHGISLIFWGDSRDESTAPYHQIVAHTRPTKRERLLSPRVVNLLAYKYYARLLQREYGSHSPCRLKEIHLYDYVRWDQDVIVDTIRKKLGWSVPDDAPTTWRVDCELVPVVNYLTAKAYGVSKIELGFSSMIRHGKMDRGEALRRAELVRQSMDMNRMRNVLGRIGVGRADIEYIL